MRLPKRQDRTLLVLIGLSLAAAYGVYWVLRHPQRLNLGLETDWLVLTLVAVTLSLLALGLFVVVLRNLIKLLIERRKGILGSRFQTKLVFIFLVLVLLPCVALFYAAVSMIVQVNETLFTEPLREVVEQSKDVVDDFNELLRGQCQGLAESLAREIAADRLLAPERGTDLRASLHAARLAGALDFVFVAEARDGAQGNWSLLGGDTGTIPNEDADLAGLARALAVPSPRSLVPEPSDEPGARVLDLMARGAMASGKAANRLDRAGAWQRASAAAPVRAGSSGTILVFVGRYLPPETALRSVKIDQAFKDYRQALKRQPQIKRTYVQLLGILTLLVLLAGTWAGVFIARQITVPIQALVEGTQAISSGDLDHRVDVKAGDELGYLIDSFNTMTGELRTSREAVSASRREIERSNRDLEERRLYIEQLLENVPAAVISLDAGIRIATMNRAAFRILGIDPSRAPIGETARVGLDRPELAGLVQEIEALGRGEKVPRVQELELAIGGRPQYLAASVSARRDAEGRLQGMLIVMEDLTPLIRAQRTTAWSEVARRIAHEIKNPLTPIQLSAQRILKKLQDQSEDFPRVAGESAAAIVSEVNTLKTLVDEFSRFARMPEVRPVPSDPNAVVEAALSLYEGVQAEIRMVRDLAPSLPVVMLDPDPMKRVLINLIDNAASAMEGRGTIVLRTRALPEERMVRIEVEDDGPGIAPENKERLFVPYFSTKRRGTGLGLAIANRIVSDHNGVIRVEDNVPRGARFVIELPA